MLCTAYGFVPDTVAFFRYRPSFRIHQKLRLKSIEALDYFFLPPPSKRCFLSSYCYDNCARALSSEEANAIFFLVCAFLLGLPFWKCGPSDCCNLRWTLFKRGLFEKREREEQFKTYFIKKALQSIDIPIDCSTSIVFLQNCIRPLKKKVYGEEQ